jgi:hypothetical protein
MAADETKKEPESEGGSTKIILGVAAAAVAGGLIY